MHVRRKYVKNADPVSPTTWGLIERIRYATTVPMTNVARITAQHTTTLATNTVVRFGNSVKVRRIVP